MVYASWRRSPRKDTNFVVKLGLSVVFLGLAFMLLNNRPSKFSPLVENSPISASQVKSSVNSQQNTDPIPTQEYSADSIKKGGKCDVLIGDWVPYEAEPLYNKSCSFIMDGHQNCMKNGRAETGYLYWRWRPRGCELPRLDPVRFLELMRNKSWAFIGDSISRNHFESLLCILSTVDQNAVLVYHNQNFKSQRWVFLEYNFTASLVWSPFLAKAVIPQDLDAVSAPEIELYLDILDENWTEQYRSWDYIIFSSGKWFSRGAIYYDYENTTILGCHYCPKRNFTELGFAFAYRKVLKNVLDYIITSNHKGMIFWRTTTPDHFEDGEWYDGGACKRKVPAKEGEFELNELDRILRDIEVEEFANASVRASENGVNLSLFDVNPLSLLRPDGHPDVYRAFAKDKNAKAVSDCLHWCLPGPIDTWNDLLMEMIVNS